MERPVSDNAAAGYVSVLETFSRLLVDSETADERAEAAREFDGSMIWLGFPDDWFLAGGAGKTCWEAYTRRANQLVCCEEILIPLGLCGRTNRPEDPLSLSDYGTRLMLAGTQGRIYVYCSRSDVLYLVARDIEEFARFGLTRRAFTYISGSDAILSPTDVECLNWTATEEVHDTASGREVLVVFAHPEKNDIVHVGYTRALGHGFVELVTPGYGPSALFLAKSPIELRNMWPFRGLNNNEFLSCWKAVSGKLRCAWCLLGVLGYRAPNAQGSEFRAEHVLIVDRFGVVYVLLLYSGFGLVRRVADNVSVLFRIGMVKRLHSGFEFHAKTRRREKLEGASRCPHRIADRLELAREHYKFFCEPTRDVIGYCSWLAQATDRTHTMPWDLRDPNVAARFLKTEAENKNPMTEYEENLTLAIMHVKAVTTTAAERRRGGSSAGKGLARVPCVYRLSFVPAHYILKADREVTDQEIVNARRQYQLYTELIVPAHGRRPYPGQ
ncbi:pr141 [rat cytomegalovirus strain Maastricht]|uniref:Pr141 n=2 Tax=Murid betaherpesvirus 2 TaxID=28304 RepID=Q9DW54_RCMVM|nr:pr141 [rat cytomegalovirus strain Maastricht]AAF99236.1 pr141 [rat cytomegalovirus strain Maastricht]WEG72055.1 protein m141 [Murid betaherpesvirus 2]CAI64576.1 r141 protein [Murid betaherpesvirus 2]